MGNPLQRLFVGVDLGATGIKAGIVNHHGQVLEYRHVSSQVAEGRQAVVQRLIAVIEGLLRPYRQGRTPVKGIGIGSPGPLDVETGVILKAPNLRGWVKVPLRAIIEQHFTFPTVLENDANAAALGEYWFGAGRGKRSLVCLTLGTGVGGGIIHGGKIWRGANGAAGEVGHMILNPDGPACACGGRGCLEVYASAKGIVARAVEAMKEYREKGEVNPQGITSEAVFQRASQGDPLFRQIRQETVKWLGVGIANLINLLNPEAVIIGGGVARASGLLPLLRREVRRRTVAPSAKITPLLLTRLGDHAGVVGAVIPFFISPDKLKTRKE